MVDFHRRSRNIFWDKAVVFKNWTAKNHQRIHANHSSQLVKSTKLIILCTKDEMNAKILKI
jgi:hypothetical protein